MSRAALSLLLLVFVLGATGAALPDRDGMREDVLRANQEKFEEWKKDRDHHARLQRDLERFWKMSPEERARLRQLDSELHQQDSLTQKRLWGALERYHAWLERLSEADRRRIESAPQSEVLNVIKELREQEWIRRLPSAEKNEVLRLKGKEREERIARLREEQRQRQQDPGPKPPVPRPKKPTRLSELPDEVRPAAEKVLKALNAQERERQKKVEGSWPGYPRFLMQMARKHKMSLPGLDDTPGPKELWEDVRRALPDVPDRTLLHFLLNEMSKEQREKLPLLSGDPAVREKVKEEYFKKHPREERRLRQLDRKAYGAFD